LLSLKEENVAEILKEVMEIFRPIAEQKNVHLLNPFSEIETQQTVYCDHDRVLQVFSNILGNAIKFTPEEGVIEIHAKTEGEEVIFSVKDSGPGIAKEDLANVFERYWQAKRTSHQGTGIGLTIAKGIVETHGGRIWVKSHLGEGSCFYFSLSAHQTKNLSRKIA
jgi:signal transduction histidine kinase